MKPETKTRILVALRVAGAIVKRYRGLIVACLVLMLMACLLLPWVDSLHEIQEITSNDEVLTKLVAFVKMSMAVMLIPTFLGIQGLLKKK